MNIVGGLVFKLSGLLGSYDCSRRAGFVWRAFSLDLPATEGIIILMVEESRSLFLNPIDTLEGERYG